jgi:hypothetical protein
LKYDIRFGQLKVAGWEITLFICSASFNLTLPSYPGPTLPNFSSHVLIALFRPSWNRRHQLTSRRYRWVEFHSMIARHSSFDWSMLSLLEVLQPAIIFSNESSRNWWSRSLYWYARTIGCKYLCSSSHDAIDTSMQKQSGVWRSYSFLSWSLCSHSSCEDLLWSLCERSVQ